MIYPFCFPILKRNKPLCVSFHLKRHKTYIRLMLVISMKPPSLSFGIVSSFRDFFLMCKAGLGTRMPNADQHLPYVSVFDSAGIKMTDMLEDSRYLTSQHVRNTCSLPRTYALTEHHLYIKNCWNEFYWMRWNFKFIF